MGTDASLFLHGFLGSKNSCPFRENCLAIELPGHGTTKIDSDMTFDRFILQLVSKIKKPLHLIGYSMGGRIAMKMAILYPHLFKSVTIGSAHPGAIGQEKDIIDRLHTMPFDAFIRYWYSKPLFGPTDIQAKLEQTAIHDPMQLALSLQCFSKKNQGDLWEGLDAISHKMVYVCGSLDPKYVGIGRRLKHLYPAIRLYTIKDCWHNVCNYLVHYAST